MAKINLPTFFDDPLRGQSEEQLFPFFSNILKGELPDYFKPIGQIGGKEFEDVLSMTQRDISRGVTEDIVRRGVTRGGVGSTAIAKATADVGRRLRFQEFERGVGARERLLTAGTGGLERVSGRSLQFSGQKNQFALNRANLELAIQNAEDAKKAAKNKQITDLISAAIGSVGTIAGFALGGPLGAGLGSAVTKTVTV